MPKNNSARAGATRGVGIGRGAGGLRLAALLLALVVAFAALPAAAAPPRYAAFMVDATTREVLYANAPDEARHPASLTKIMTLYLVFDALEAGRLSLTDQVPISRLAASQAPSRLGLAVGQSLSVDNAISVTAVKSANDIAVALAERVGGSVPRFLTMMNMKAAALGMRHTHFSTPSGLTQPDNVTTARDLAILSLALIRNHPRFYRYFGERDFVWQRATLINHNHLLGRMVGMDGIKTGYTLDAGFALAASAIRGNRRLVAIILGEPSIAARNRDVQALVEAGFAVIDRRALGQQVSVASVLPTLDHPALRVESVVEQGSSDDAPRAAPIRRAPAPAVRHHATAKTPARAHAGKPVARAHAGRGAKASKTTAAKKAGAAKGKPAKAKPAKSKTARPGTAKPTRKKERHHR